MKEFMSASAARWAIIVTALACCAGRAGASPEDVSLIRSAGGSVSFEITVPPPGLKATESGTRIDIPGYGCFSPPGAPMLPSRTFNVAVPPDGGYSVSWSVTASEDLGRFTLSRMPGERFVRYDEDGIPVTEQYLPDDPWGGDIPYETVMSSGTALMGRVRVLPIRVSPVSVAGGAARIARKISVTVNFTGDSPVSRESRTYSREDRPSQAWKRLFGRTLVNPADIDRFAAPLRDTAPVPTALQGGRRFKIKILETGVYSARADSLIASGLSPDLINEGFALKKIYFDSASPGLAREEDIPYRVIKGSSSAPGIFGGDDLLVFFAESVKDDAEAGDTIATYNGYNIVWLVENEAGTLMPDGPALPSGATLQLTRFTHEEKIRKDKYYYKYVRAGYRDFNYIVGPKLYELPVAFDARSVYADGTFSIHVRVMGTLKDERQDLEFFLRNSSGTWQIGSGFILSTEEKVFDLRGITSSRLIEGRNELVISGVEQYGFLVNDMKVVYPRTMRAYGDMLEFKVDSQLLGERRVEISGFSVGEGYIVDITDPDAPQFIPMPPDSFAEDGGTYTLSLCVSGESERRFVALGRGGGRHINNIWIELDSPSSIVSSPGPYDALVIAHSIFLPPATDRLMQYVSWREEQGYRILAVDVEDVFDEFNGGLISADAIRRLIKYGVDVWGVEFVMLVGDASEDHRRMFIGNPPDVFGSAPDYVPAYTYSVNVFGREKDEVVASDKYYEFLDETPPTGLTSPIYEDVPPGLDNSDRDYLPSASYPDVVVGRLPTGSELELRAVLTKIFRYEEPAGSDTWRRNIVLFSDDAWSGTLSAYAYNPTEQHFEWGMDSVAVNIEEALPGGFAIQDLDLSRWTDGQHPDMQGGAAVLSVVTDSTRKYFTPYLNRKINNGCLIYAFQGHAARSHFTTESAFSNFSQYQDIDSIYSDRNHIFLGLGCHISDFAIMYEYSLAAVDGPNGDCITEQLLLKSRAGAIGTYASTGFEYLLQNEELCTRMFEVMFQRPPTDSIPPEREYTGARWILGEVLAAGEIEHLGSASFAYEQLYRYILLGDPMLNVELGPPLMRIGADWGGGFEELESDTLRARNSTNDCRLIFRASDIVALGEIRFEVDGEDRSGELTVVPTIDGDLSYARGYEASVDYSITLQDHSLLFRVFSPEGIETGLTEVHIAASMSLYNGSLAIPPGGESPPQGDFLFTVRFPVWLDEAPTLLFDDFEMNGVEMRAPDQQDSTRWEASFSRTLAAGDHELSVVIGDYRADYPFTVSGSGLEIDVFNFPNPFADGTNICYSLNLPADAGAVRIYNVSGVLVREIRISRAGLGAASRGAPNAVWWDGRDLAGDPVANGTYIYIVEVEKDGGSVSHTGKAVKLE